MVAEEGISIILSYSETWRKTSELYREISTDFFQKKKTKSIECFKRSEKN